jgi:hypothetical protein
MLHNKELCVLYRSHTVVRLVKSGRLYGYTVDIVVLTDNCILFAQNTYMKQINMSWDYQKTSI